MMSILYLQSESIGDTPINTDLRPPRNMNRRASHGSSGGSSDRDSISVINSQYSDSDVSTTSQQAPTNHELTHDLTEAIIDAYASPELHVMHSELYRLLDVIPPNQIPCEAALTFKIANKIDIVQMIRFDAFTLFEAMQQIKHKFDTYPLLHVSSTLLQEWNILNERYKSEFIEYRNMDLSEGVKSSIVFADWKYAEANVANKRRSKNYEEFRGTINKIATRLVNKRAKYYKYLDDVTAILCMVVDLDGWTTNLIFRLQGYENHQRELYDGMQKVWLLIQGPRFKSSPRKEDLEINWQHYDREFRSKDGLPNPNMYRKLSNKADTRRQLLKILNNEE